MNIELIAPTVEVAADARARRILAILQSAKQQVAQLYRATDAADARAAVAGQDGKPGIPAQPAQPAVTLDNINAKLGEVNTASVVAFLS